MNKVKYSALIRTFNSERTIPETLSSLRRQTIQPVQYIFVDSGSNDKTLLLIPENSVVHHFVGNEFNYSEALNQGLEYVSVDFVLIISSHTSLLNPKAVEYALEVLRSNEKR